MAANLEQLGLDRLIADEGGDVFLSDYQRAELLRRIAEDDANLDVGIPWEEVKAMARLRNE